MSAPLTTIHQPLVEIGKTAVTMLMRLIAGEQLDSNHVELSTSLVVRKSCAPPRDVALVSGQIGQKRDPVLLIRGGGGESMPGKRHGRLKDGGESVLVASV